MKITFVKWAVVLLVFATGCHLFPLPEFPDPDPDPSGPNDSNIICGDQPFNHDCIRGDSVLIEEVRQVATFNKVINRTCANIEIGLGASQNVTVRAPENLINYFTTTIRGDSLIFDLVDTVCVRHRNVVDLVVTVPEIVYIQNRGAGDIRGLTNIEGNVLDLDLSGAGNINLELGLDSLYYHGQGVGTTTLTGQVRSQKVDMTGVGNYRAFEMVSQNCDISLTGIARAEVHAQETLNVVITGAGRVFYKGDPAITADIGILGELIDAN